MSTVAPQALFLLNSPFATEQARSLAQRLAKEVPANDEARIDRAYRLLFARPARPQEAATGKRFLARAAGRGADAAWTDYAHLLLCSNEFVYLD